MYGRVVYHLKYTNLNANACDRNGSPWTRSCGSTLTREPFVPRSARARRDPTIISEDPEVR